MEKRAIVELSTTSRGLMRRGRFTLRNYARRFLVFARQIIFVVQGASYLHTFWQHLICRMGVAYNGKARRATAGSEMKTVSPHSLGRFIFILTVVCLLQPPPSFSQAPVLGTVVDNYLIPVVSPSGVCVDGNSFWISNYSANGGPRYIYKINIGNRAVTDSIPAPDWWTSGMAWDGTHLWVIDAYPTTQISLIELSITGSILKYYKCIYTCAPAGIAWNGKELYYGTNVCWASPAGQRSMIYKVNPETGTAIDSFPPPSGNINGLVYNKGHLWYCDDNYRYIFEIDTTGNMIREFPAYGRLLTGLTIARGYLWAVDMEGINGPRVYEIDIGLAPAIPQKFEASGFTGYIQLTWAPSVSRNVKWYKIYSNLSDNLTTATLLDSVNGNTTTYTDSTAPNGYYTYYWVSAVDSEGVESHVSEMSQANALPYLKYKLFQNYPNPFSEKTAIAFEIQPPATYLEDGSMLSSHVNISVYDVLGRKVATVFDGDITAGDRTIEYNASDLPSGVYFCRMRAGVFVETKKLVVVK